MAEIPVYTAQFVYETIFVYECLSPVNIGMGQID